MYTYTRCLFYCLFDSLADIEMFTIYILMSVHSVFRKLIMSHHIVTVCVVCVLCAAHIPCSAHTNLSTNARSFDLNSNIKTTSDLLAQSLLSRSKDTAKDQYKSPPSSSFVNNKHDTVRFDSTGYVNTNSVAVIVDNAISTTSHGIYLKKKTTKDFKGGGSMRNMTQSSLVSADKPMNSRDTELQRLAQIESLNVSRKSAQSSKNLPTINTLRLKRDVDVDERYFMRKIFEAYGDGTSITMDGFEKLVRKLGLLRLLTDASELEGRL